MNYLQIGYIIKNRNYRKRQNRKTNANFMLYAKTKIS